MRKRFTAIVLAWLFAAPLTYAQMTNFDKLVSSGSSEAVLAAIKQGANVNAKDNQGMTPLLWAAGNNPDPDVIVALLNAGADSTARMGNGMTLLIAAAAGNKNPETITTLLKAGLDINAQTYDGMTALMWAAWNNPNPGMITTLLRSGADPKARSKDGKTAYDYALESGLLKDTEALQQLSESEPAEGKTQPSGTKLLSSDGGFVLYAPTQAAPLTAEQVASNKKLFALMESQVKHRPVIISFEGWIPPGLLQWMLATYGSELADYWGHGGGDVAEATASYFVDRTADEDFVIDVRSRYSSKPGTEILLMTYEYFMATR